MPHEHLRRASSIPSSIEVPARKSIAQFSTVAPFFSSHNWICAAVPILLRQYPRKISLREPISRFHASNRLVKSAALTQSEVASLGRYVIVLPPPVHTIPLFSTPSSAMIIKGRPYVSATAPS